MPLFPHYRGGQKALNRRNRPKSIFRGAIEGVKVLGSLTDTSQAVSHLLRGVGAAKPIIDLITKIQRATGGGGGGKGGGRGRRGVASDGDDELNIALDLAESFLREHRPELFKGQPAAKPNRGRSAEPDTYPLKTRPDNRVTATAGGRTMWVQPDDPLITGEMINVESSNVHSIGFDWDGQSQHGTLKIRFLQKDRRRGGRSKTAGPQYEYENVHPYVFESMRTASSKGSFVWDRIRVRGTVSGHRYRYKLAGIAQGYVPREAKAYGQGDRRKEYFIGRQLRARSPSTGETQTFQSALPDRLVGRYQPELQALASRGIPNRGLPNRGR
jgi:hypothetical protein